MLADLSVQNVSNARSIRCAVICPDVSSCWSANVSALTDDECFECLERGSCHVSVEGHSWMMYARAVGGCALRFVHLVDALSLSGNREGMRKGTVVS